MIRALGRYWPQDAQGNLQNDSSLEKVAPHWRELLASLTAAYLERLGNGVHSIYLRGSVPRGQAIDYLSDLDTFALVRQPGIAWQSLDWETDRLEHWQKTYPFVVEVEGAIASIDERGELENPRLKPVIKLQSCCLWGENIQATLATYQAGPALAMNYRWLKADLQQLLSAEYLELKTCRSILKSILRTGFELVMEREKCYTVDLYPCWRSFSKYYPEWEEAMRRILLFYLQPPPTSQELQPLVEDLGTWMLSEVARVFGK